jgi:mRNA interferase RelE/StbE
MFSRKAEKQLDALDGYTKKQINAYLRKNVAGSMNPREHGKRLSANLAGYWRYRIGDYRVICEIRDDSLTVVALQVGHRSKIYF